MPFSLIYHRPTGGAEIVGRGNTAVDTLGLLGGRRLIFRGAHFRRLTSGNPYWATPVLRIAALGFILRWRPFYLFDAVQ